MLLPPVHFAWKRLRVLRLGLEVLMTASLVPRFISEQSLFWLLARIDKRARSPSFRPVVQAPCRRCLVDFNFFKARRWTLPPPEPPCPGSGSKIKNQMVNVWSCAQQKSNVQILPWPQDESLSLLRMLEGAFASPACLMIFEAQNLIRVTDIKSQWHDCFLSSPISYVLAFPALLHNDIPTDGMNDNHLKRFSC